MYRIACGRWPLISRKKERTARLRHWHAPSNDFCRWPARRKFGKNIGRKPAADLMQNVRDCGCIWNSAGGLALALMEGLFGCARSSCLCTVQVVENGWDFPTSPRAGLCKPHFSAGFFLALFPPTRHGFCPKSNKLFATNHRSDRII